MHASDVEDADIDEIRVTSVGIDDFVAFGPVEKGESVVVVGNVAITAMVSYTHPDWDNAMYDSEDKVLIPFDSVSGETEVTIEAPFSMSLLVDDDGAIMDIEEFRFRDDRFAYVELHPQEDYR